MIFMGETNYLPTAAEILREGLVLARGLTSGPHDLDRARVLLDYARELREGSVAATADEARLLKIIEDTDARCRGLIDANDEGRRLIEQHEANEKALSQHVSELRDERDRWCERAQDLGWGKPAPMPVPPPEPVNGHVAESHPAADITRQFPRMMPPGDDNRLFLPLPPRAPMPRVMEDEDGVCRNCGTSVYASWKAPGEPEVLRHRATGEPSCAWPPLADGPIAELAQ